MKRLLVAAILALLIHGTIFSLHPGWLSEEPPIMSSSPGISITLQTFQKPEASNLQDKSDNSVLSEKEVEPILIEDNKEQSPTEKKRLLPETEQKIIEAPQKKKAISSGSALAETPVEQQEISQQASTEMEPRVDSASKQVPSHKISGKSEKFDDNNQNTAYGNDKSIIKATPLYKQIPKPKYPKLARKRGYQGTVQLEVFVGDDGMVRDLRVASSSGYPILDRAATDSVRKWIFKPGRRGTTKIAMWVNVPVTFLLNK